MQEPPTSNARQRDVYSVSRLNREARALLEGGLPLLWVEGEISNLARPSSGHLYFTLKDEQAQVRCALFRMNALRLGFAPENGAQVLARARVSLYEARGEFQLIVEHLEPAGEGALRRAFELLKQRLAAEGLFDEAHKKPLPALPRQIGILTSPTGAALRDILTTLRRRFPALPVLIYPIPVQGAGAAQKIAAMLRTANARAECDVLALARGGGSLEDLWAFNEEAVARAIYASPIPVVTGIGHEIDFTIADFAADRRAPTPTAAAELISPDRSEWFERLTRLENRMWQAAQRRLGHLQQALHNLQKRLQHPGRRLRDQAQRLDGLEQRLHHARRVALRHAHARLAELAARLHTQTPLHRLRQAQSQLAYHGQRLRAAAQRLVEQRRAGLQTLTRALDAVSPLATLARGYAIVRLAAAPNVLRNARDAAPGDTVHARLAQGSLICKVERTLGE
ncbi:MAG: exodeoxyribonuclease VII large subunit [Gammaproteobacteria bacterium]|nr:MAG: exodeoxyribonuclease VII large subunit [Gammaproteobacteria bacterium]